jgi:hypothetical protein
MDIVDLVEMLCDWKAATMRHDGGDIERSIAINAERFGISDQLAGIIKNSVAVLNRACQPIGKTETR